MPTYAYACKDCSHAFDIHQSFSDDALTNCPECAGTLRKKFNSVGVVFKGSGFYRTDSRDAKGTGTVAAASAKSDGGSTGGSASTTAPSTAAPAAAAPASAASSATS